MARHSSPYRILLVDDVPTIRQALRWLLDDIPDFKVVGEAADGQTAVTYSQQLNPDIVILDVELPNLDGFTVTQQLKQFAAPPLVIFLTWHGDSQHRQQATAVGGDGFVEKGQGWNALLATIRQLINSPMSAAPDR